MKRIILIFLCALSVGLAHAQTQDEAEETNKTPDIPGTILMDFGFNSFINSPDELDINWFKSKSFGLYYMREFKLGKKLTFNPAVGISFEKYGFNRDITIGYTLLTAEIPSVPAEGVNPAVPGTPATYEFGVVDLSSEFESVNKSQMAMNYLEIPLQFRYYFKGNDRKGTSYVALGGMAALLIESHTKLKYTQGGRDRTEKIRDDFQQSTIRYGIQARFGFGSVNFFYKRYLSDIFNENGPAGAADMSSSTIGISISGL